MSQLFDLSLYLKAMAAGTPILFVVWGLVEIVKRLKKSDGTPRVHGDALFWVSFGIGFVLGNAYMIFASPPPTEQGWYPIYGYIFGNATWSAGLGILASLFHDNLRKKAEESVAEIAKTDDPGAL